MILWAVCSVCILGGAPADFHIALLTGGGHDWIFGVGVVVGVDESITSTGSDESQLADSGSGRAVLLNCTTVDMLHIQIYGIH